ncbi:hypothetical protein [Methylophaga sulfidovorans]|jgi:hypothetical protein|uniref:DUF4145 domain-containing protein n=1 Tax=Methylophaga sulfidovorans TaxID=45496 RepID=A0A1I3TST8_9GAMM|nr:hypothetical protein [Methylophaga sulfidovorans]SFJ73399.1 hypothetical protein SAMN04488079_1012 [Methylophaga sulfidovorans]
MDNIISLIDILAWPIFMLIFVLIFKSDVSNLVEKISSISHKETKVDFTKAVSDASKNLDISGSGESLDAEWDLEASFPRGSIIESWLRVEDAIREYNTRHGIESDPKKPFRNSNLVINSLFYEQLGKGTLQMLNNLRVLRNEAVHLSDKSITQEAAKEYKSMAEKVISTIEMA